MMSDIATVIVLCLGKFVKCEVGEESELLGQMRKSNAQAQEECDQKRNLKVREGK